jgi:malonate-semialdehyde dehydrogenase (acetylating)/methylmalonate-semialdehyde dehydrogenase
MKTNVSQAETLKNLVGDQWLRPGGAQVDDLPDPASGDIIARVPYSTPADVDAAVGAAERAFPACR